MSGSFLNTVVSRLKSLSSKSEEAASSLESKPRRKSRSIEKKLPIESIKSWNGMDEYSQSPRRMRKALHRLHTNWTQRRAQPLRMPSVLDMDQDVFALKASSADAAAAIQRQCIVFALTTTVKGAMLFARPEHKDCVLAVALMWRMYQIPGTTDALIQRLMGPEGN